MKVQASERGRYSPALPLSDTDRQFIHSTYLEEGPRICRYLAGRFGMQYHDAQDVVQETFIRTIHVLPKIDKTRIGGWLMRTAHHTACNYMRDNRRLRNATSIETANIPTEETTSLENLEASDLKARTHRAFDKIPKPTRRMLRLHAQGLGPGQIGKIVGLHGWAVRQQIDIAKAALQNYIYATKENENI